MGILFVTKPECRMILTYNAPLADSIADRRNLKQFLRNSAGARRLHVNPKTGRKTTPFEFTITPLAEEHSLLLLRDLSSMAALERSERTTERS